MSGRTSSVILLESLLFIPAVAVVGTARLAGKALSALQMEYRKAQEESEARHQEELKRRAEALRAQQREIDRIFSLMGRTVTERQENAPNEMLRESEAHVAEPRRVKSEGTGDESADVGADVKNEIRAMREKIAFGIPESGPWSTTREALAAKVDDLERLAAVEPAAARQGISMLRQRIDRRVRECAESESRGQIGQEDQKRWQAAFGRLGELDGQVSSALVDMRAKLALVSGHEELPALCNRAKGLARRLEQLSSAGGEVSALGRIQSEVNWLVEDLCSHIAGDEIRSIVSHHVKDVLLTLGYKVKETPSPSTPGSTLVTTIAPDVGVEFSVNSSGQVTTEMVSLSSQVRDATPLVEESACELAEMVRKGLNARGLKTQERTRYYLKPGDTLRRVNIRVDLDTGDEHQGERNRRSAGDVQ